MWFIFVQSSQVAFSSFCPRTSSTNNVGTKWESFIESVGSYIFRYGDLYSEKSVEGVGCSSGEKSVEGIGCSSNHSML